MSDCHILYILCECFRLCFTSFFLKSCLSHTHTHTHTHTFRVIWTQKWGHKWGHKGNPNISDRRTLKLIQSLLNFGPLVNESHPHCTDCLWFQQPGQTNYLAPRAALSPASCLLWCAWATWVDSTGRLWGRSDARTARQESLPAKHLSTRDADEATKSSLHNWPAWEKSDVTTRRKLFIKCKTEVRKLHLKSLFVLWGLLTCQGKIIRGGLNGEWQKWMSYFSPVCAGRVWTRSHHLLCNIPTALTERLQLQLGLLRVDFPVPAPGDGGCTNSVTPTASFSLQLVNICVVCVCVCVCVCEQQLREQLSIVTCFICAHTQRWAQTAPLKSVSSLWEPTALPHGSFFGKHCFTSDYQRRRRKN